MEADFRALLVADAGLDALIDGEITWGKRNQGQALPSIVLNMISRNHSYTHGGIVNLKKSRVQLDIYASNYEQCTEIRDALTGIFEDVKATQGNTEFHVFMESEKNGNEISDAEKLSRISIDLMVNHKEI